MVNITFKSSEDIINKLQQLKGKTKPKKSTKIEVFIIMKWKLEYKVILFSLQKVL